MSQYRESRERLERPLIRLAKAVGVATSYMGMSNDYHEIADDVLVSVLAALGIDASSDEAIAASLKTLLDDKHRRLVAPTVLHVEGSDSKVLVNVGVFDIPEASITLEDGTPYQGKVMPDSGDGSTAYWMNDAFVTTASVVIPADLPIGYHTLHVKVAGRTQDATLISVPKRIELIDAMKEHRLWGWMAQIYSIRSRESWGVGDFADLGTMLSDAKTKTGADFMLINPVHAAEPVTPLTPSPYLPISRTFLNFTYIRPEAIAEYGLLGEESRARVKQLHDSVRSLNTNTDHIDRDAMWAAKMQALWIIFKAGRTPERQAAFDEYKRSRGEGLEAYATWCLAYDKWGAPSASPSSWFVTTNKDSAEVKALRDRYPDTLDFYRWMEWIATEQLADAQGAARKAGMELGVMADMAVGVHPLGADVWWNPDRYANGATVGAPPDMFNQQGQDWSQPPLNPISLEKTGYLAYREMVHAMFAQAGALRIDHILGLFRLWWIPAGKGAKNGTYVAYDSAIMLGILALEAARAHGVVVGEDLGVVPEQVASSLASHGVLGCAVEWFEQMNGVFRDPRRWREMALASVDVHDMPPCAGYLQYEHVKVRAALGLLEGSVDDFQKSAEAEQRAMLRMLLNGGWISADCVNDVPGHLQQIIEGMYRAMTASPCKLLAAAIVDGVGETRTQNQPGTNNEYPNWRVPLADGDGNPIMVEGLFDQPRMQSLARVLNA
ncbi:4-alpha-glucanotransferase [Bifidobacterium vespertilionis]|uniref:4-alpha-glucanotransferase n=1 Tax=Bifidobacterium vespertilionis TaxID=2562524 RepID=A0A5J5E553_9BIFI|nr:4-alpha-glucanotransferase [Bifidobacterium vespertilionis]KAA8821361.1 4-alpha-glucanotransferase [Bifidobacterium vespertilionis]KAA8824306.1 4-alpha-glucanotransferase [Bifidobacterium vespertilionis]MBT1178546.1 4-alpha-glucanotransferase [Bifidobacterium vespertilionis]